MASEPLPDTWHTRDLPVLREAVLRLDNGDHEVHARAIAEDLDMPYDDVAKAFRNLLRTELLVEPPPHARKGVWKMDSAVAFSEEALVRTGAWPSPQTALDRLVAALEQIAANTDDEDTRTNARKFADWLRTGASTVGLSVASAAITGQLPT